MVSSIFLCKQASQPVSVSRECLCGAGYMQHAGLLKLDYRHRISRRLPIFTVPLDVCTGTVSVSAVRPYEERLTEGARAKTKAGEIFLRKIFHPGVK
ncbi:hypothetical protein BaRGS_00012928 [Batillaria attramentaria]|uniref:Uncharacterized protein n=1 Tax=Batillaria attramentaria TaxID=370345 RepID=A0ABD0L987_9CAEN